MADHKCANCNVTFIVRTDGKGYIRHSLTAKLRRGESVTVGDAIALCLKKDVTTTDTVFICAMCFQLLKDLYDYKKSEQLFQLRSTKGSYLEKKRPRTPSRTPREIKKKMVSTPVKKISTPAKKSVAMTGTSERSYASKNIKKAIQYLSAGQYVRGMRRLLESSPGMKRAIRQTVAEQVCKEISEVCRKKDTSMAETVNMDVLEKFSWIDVIDYMKQKTPFLLGILTSTQQKRKSLLAKNIPEELSRTIGCVLSLILFKRNRKFNLLQTVNSIELWIGGCKSSVMTQFNRMGWCLSGNATRSAIDRIRKGFDRDVKDAQQQIQEQMERDDFELMELEEDDEDVTEDDNNGWETDEEDDDEHPQARKKLFDVKEGDNPGCTFCWDNIGRHTIARHQTKDSQNKMHLWALAYVAINRVPTTHLSLTDAIDAVDIPLDNFLPNDDDLKDLKNRLIHTVSKILCQYLPYFQESYKAILVDDIAHDKIELLKNKSKVVNLGIIQENPSTVAGTIAILQKLQVYVPVKEEKFNTCIVYGDGLTCERHNDAHNARSNGLTPEERLEGLQPSPQEFHKRMLLLRDTMDMFFSGSSACDKGTLSNIKNAYGHRSVQKDVGKCFNYAVDLLDHATDSLTLTLAMQQLQMKKITDDPKDAPGPLASDQEKKHYIAAVSARIVDTVWQDIGLRGLQSAIRGLQSAIRNVNNQEQTNVAYPYCFCHEELDDEVTMILCNNKDCKNKWFHLECVNLTTEQIEDMENTSWYCSDSCKPTKKYSYCVCKTDLGDDEPMVECGNSKCPKGEWFHWSCLNLTESDIPKGRTKWYCCNDCKCYKRKKSDNKTACGTSSQDHQTVYMCALLWRGLGDRIRKAAVRNGDGPAMIRHWKFDLIEFFARHHTKYVILAHRLIAGVNGWYPSKLREDVIWNRTVNYSGGQRGNLPMDLVNEYLNKEFVMSLRKTGSLTKDTVDRHGMVVGSLRRSLDTVYADLAGDRVWSSRGGKRDDRDSDVLQLTKSLVQCKAFDRIPGRAFKAYPGFTYPVKISDPKRFANKLKYLGKRLDIRKRVQH